MTSQADLLFVYGTLKRGHGNHGCLNGAPFVNEAQLRGTLISLGGFPGLLRGPEELDGLVHGEVYEIQNASVWASVDGLEGYDPDRDPWGCMYLKREVTLVDGRKAFTYIWNGGLEDGPILENGKW